MAHSISTVTARAKLKPSREPYWFRITTGFYLGFRKMTPTSEGTWIFRAMDVTTRNEVTKTMGDFCELPAHQRFDAAQTAAMLHVAHIGKGGIIKPKTIRDVCESYVNQPRQNKTESAAKDAEKRFNSYVLDNERFAALELSKLTPAHIDSWRKTLAKRPTTSGGNRGEKRTASTLNRDMTPFRAALNHAFEESWVTSDFAWRGKLKPIEDADKKRELYLDKDQRTKFISMATPDLALFLRGMAMLPVRPGALSTLTVGDFDKRLMTLQIKVDKTGTRKIKLPAATADVFALTAKDKLPSAPLFARSNGSAWNKDSWKYPVKDAATAANMPEGTTAYTLRHSVISDLVHGGLDLLTVAQISGTSVRMIEKHYGHLRGEIAANALASLVL